MKQLTGNNSKWTEFIEFVEFDRLVSRVATLKFFECHEAELAKENRTQKSHEKNQQIKILSSHNSNFSIENILQVLIERNVFGDTGPFEAIAMKFNWYDFFRLKWQNL